MAPACLRRKIHQHKRDEITGTTGMSACCRKYGSTIASIGTWKAPADILQHIGALPTVFNCMLAESGEAGAGVAGRSEQEAESCLAKIKRRQQATSPV